MFENGEMRHVENILRRGEEGIKDNDGVGEFNYFFCKNLCKCHNVPLVQQ
jgi:hypothetical protein